MTFIESANPAESIVNTPLALVDFFRKQKQGMVPDRSSETRLQRPISHFDIPAGVLCWAAQVTKSVRSTWHAFVDKDFHLPPGLNTWP